MTEAAAKSRSDIEREFEREVELFEQLDADLDRIPTRTLASLTKKLRALRETIKEYVVDQDEDEDDELEDEDDELEDEDEDEDDELEFAEGLLAAIDEHAHGIGRRNGKVFVYSAWEAWKREFGSMELDAFKNQLLAAHRRGEIRLTRSDYIYEGDPNKAALERLLEQSQIDVEIRGTEWVHNSDPALGWTRPHFHQIVLPETGGR